MLDSKSFLKYRGLCVSEVIGNGALGFEYLIENFNGAVARVVVRANDLDSSAEFFAKRFTLRAISSSSVVSERVGTYYNYKFSRKTSPQTAFQSVICRRVY